MAWLSREPGIAPLHRLPRLQGANLQNAGAHPVFQPPPHDGAVALRDDDIEGDRPAEKMRLASPVGRIVEAEHDGNAGPDARMRRGRNRELEWRDTRCGHARSPDHQQSGEGRVTCHGVTCRDPSSSSTFLSGLNTSSVPDELPPHRMPARALLDV